MCGLWFSVGFTPEASRIERVSHRGPDGWGFHVLDALPGKPAIGHRRLAIIDLNREADQPFVSTDGRHQLIFNGQIYNYLELRSELESAGERFRTKSDTEVLLVAFRRWGPAALNRLQGMFAFVIVDTEARSVFAARDRFGIKPLYIVETPIGVALASEIKQLHDLPGVPRRPNRKRVEDFLATGVLDHTTETLFEGVSQLGAGELLQIDLQQPFTVRRQRWYSLPAADDISLTFEDAAERLHELFDEFITLHLRSDVPVGSCLSGGLDSSAIVGAIGERRRVAHATQPFHAITASFRGTAVDETAYAEMVAAHAEISHELVTPSPEGLIDAMDALVWHQDEPFGSSSIFAQWSVFVAARRLGIPVMLDGQGADEILGGYHYLFGHDLADLFRTGRLGETWTTFADRRRVHGLSPVRQLSRFLMALAPDPIARLAQKRVTRQGWLLGTPSSATRRRHRDMRSRLEWLTTHASLPSLLHWEDRSSMAHGVEARVPFLHHPLVEFCLSLPRDLRYRRGTTKALLRQVARPNLPAKVVDRVDKLGFATPEEQWFRGPLAGKVQGLISDAGRTLEAYVDPSALNLHAGEVLAGRRPFDSALFRVMCTAVWVRRFGLSV